MPFCYGNLSLPLRGRQSHRGQAFPSGGAKSRDVQPSPQEARSAGCRGHPRAVARRAGRGVPRRASLPAKRPSNNVPSKPSPQEKVARRAERGVPRRASLPAKRPSNFVPSKPSPQEKVARRAGRGVPRRAFLPRKGHRTMSPHPASLRSPTFPLRGRQSHRGKSRLLRGRGSVYYRL